MNLSSIKPNFSTANTANTLVQRDASGKVAVSLANSAITGETALTAVAGDDAILVSDTSAAAVRKVAINDLLTFMNTNITKQNPIAQIFGSGGSHSLGAIYNPSSTNWISISGGQIQLSLAGIYHFEIFYGGNYTGGCYNYTSSMYPILRRMSDSATILSGPVSGSRDSNFSGDGGSFSGLVSISAVTSFGIYIILGGACSGYLGNTSALVTKIQ